MDFFKSTLDLLKRDDNKLFKNTASPSSSHKSSPGVNSFNGESNVNIVNNNTATTTNNTITTANTATATTTATLPPPQVASQQENSNLLPVSSSTTTITSNNGNNGVQKNQPSTTTTTNNNSINPPSPLTSPNTSEQELWKLLEKQRQLRKRKPPLNGSTVPLSNIPNNSNIALHQQQQHQIKPVSSNPSMKRKIGGGGVIQPASSNVNSNGPTVKTQQPPKKIKTDIR